MKNRDYKEFAFGSIVHIYNRGNNKEKIFFEEQDYKAFLFRLGLVLGFEESKLQSEKLLSLPYTRVRITDTNANNFKLHAFCLMPNHFHLIIEQTGKTSISKLLLKLSTSYARYLNNKYKRVGHVFQDQFKAVQIDSNPQLMWTSAYIHMNPVKDGLVNSPSQYEWSSYKDYVNERSLLLVETALLKSIFGGISDFEKETLILSVDNVKGAL